MTFVLFGMRQFRMDAAAKGQMGWSDVNSEKKPSPNAANLRLISKEYDIPRIRELALDAIKQSVLIADANGDDQPIIYANAAFSELTGYSSEEIVGQNCRFLTGPETSYETRAQIRAALATRMPFSGLILNYRKDGTAFWNQFSLSPLQDDELGNYWIGIQVDVTEQREMEARLRESQRMEAVGKLSGGIAHDFNNILALILGNAEIIAGEAEKGSLTGESAADIIEAAEGGSKLVKSLLQYASGEGGAREEVQVNATIERVVAMLRRTIGESIRIDTDPSAAVGLVHVDRPLFETALLNLMLNARDAMHHGGRICISTRRRTNAGPALGTVAAIAVTDTGTGMDAAVLARAFEPFFTTKNDGRGNGLGLAMVYNFVKQSGGDVKVESVVGQGTTVTMLLPVEQPSVSAVPTSDGNKRIMIVEDDSKVRSMLARHLDRAGYAVDEVASAEEALERIEADVQPTMLVSDIRLREGMSGVELVALLRKRGSEFPMLLITGYADELEPHADTIDGVPVLRKPFRSADLLAEIDRMIDQRSASEG